MQDDINKVYDYVTINIFSLNMDKVSVLPLCTSGTSTLLNTKYKLKSFTLPVVSEVRDLGIYIDARLSFRYVKFFYSYCLRLINICFRLFKLRNADVYLKFYVYILSKIYYCFSIYSRVSVLNTVQIEKIIIIIELARSARPKGH